MIEKEAKKIIARLQKQLKQDFGTTVNIKKVVVSNRLRVTWGQAEDPEGKPIIKLARKVFEGKTDTEAFRDTVIHEFCHHADHKLYGGWGHGPGWQSLMVHFGQTPSVLVTDEHEKELNTPMKRKCK